MNGKANINISHKLFQEMLYHVETDTNVEESIEDMLLPLLTDWSEREKKYGDEKKGYQWESIYIASSPFHVVGV